MVCINISYLQTKSIQITFQRCLLIWLFLSFLGKSISNTLKKHFIKMNMTALTLFSISLCPLFYINRRSPHNQLAINIYGFWLDVMRFIFLSDS